MSSLCLAGCFWKKISFATYRLISEVRPFYFFENYTCRQRFSCVSTRSRPPLNYSTRFVRNSLVWLAPCKGQIQPTTYTNDLRLIFRGQPRLCPSQLRSGRHHESIEGYSYRWVAMCQEIWGDTFNVIGNFKVMAQLAFWITSCFQELILESNESDGLRSPLQRSRIQRSPLGCG